MNLFIYKCTLLIPFIFFNLRLLAQVQNGSLLITELMIDPTPSLGLPSVEYIELYNNTSSIIDLNQCYFLDEKTGSLIGGEMPSQSFLVLTKSENVKLFPSNTKGLDRWPSLNNDQDKLFIVCQQDTVFSLHYITDEIENINQQAGGIALEMINIENWSQSFANNYHYCNNSIGGTPGTNNSLGSNKQKEIYLKNLQSLYSKNIQFEMYCPYQALYNIYLFDLSGQLKATLASQERIFQTQKIDLNLNYSKLIASTYILAIEIINKAGDIKRFKHGIMLSNN